MFSVSNFLSMRGSNDKQRRQADAMDNTIIDFLKTMPDNDATWSALLAQTKLHDTQLDRGLRRLVRFGVVEKRSMIYHLKNPSLKRVFTEKRPEHDDKTRRITRLKFIYVFVRDYGTWRHGTRLDPTPDLDFNKYSRRKMREEKTATPSD